MKNFEKIIKKYKKIDRNYKKIKKKYKNIIKNSKTLEKYKKLLIEYESIQNWFRTSIENLNELKRLKTYQIYRKDKLYLRKYKRLTKKLSDVALICDYCGEPKPLIDFVYDDIDYLNQHCIECYLMDMQEVTGFPYYSDYIKYKTRIE